MSNGVNIYLASRYSRRDELCRYRTDLEALGFTMPSERHRGKHKMLTAEKPVSLFSGRVVPASRAAVEPASEEAITKARHGIPRGVDGFRQDPKNGPAYLLTVSKTEYADGMPHLHHQRYSWHDPLYGRDGRMLTSPGFAVDACDCPCCAGRIPACRHSRRIEAALNVSLVKAMMRARNAGQSGPTEIAFCYPDGATCFLCKTPLLRVRPYRPVLGGVTLLCCPSCDTGRPV